MIIKTVLSSIQLRDKTYIIKNIISFNRNIYLRFMTKMYNMQKYRNINSVLRVFSHAISVQCFLYAKFFAIKNNSRLSS